MSQKKGEQTERQVLANCWNYFALKKKQYSAKNLLRIFGPHTNSYTEIPIEERTDDDIECLIAEVANEMDGDLSFPNWKAAVDKVYQI